MTQLVIHSKDKCVFMIYRSVIYNSFLRHKQNTSMLSRKHRLAKAHLNDSRDEWHFVLRNEERQTSHYKEYQFASSLAVWLCALGR